MGRASLMFVILMTTIFASVLVRVQRSIGGVPDVLIRNQLNKEIENVSDYVLRREVRNANSQDFLDAVLDEASSAGNISHIETYAEGERRIGNCDIQRIEYSYAHTTDHYKVKTQIRGFMQGVEVFRDAEMAFSYPMATLGKMVPDVVYLEFERLNLFTWFTDILGWIFGVDFDARTMADSSGNNYESQFEGFSLISPSAPYSIVDSGLDEEVEEWSGAYSKRYLKFNGYNNWVKVNNKLPVGSAEAESLNTDTEFSLMCFAKIDKNGRDVSYTFDKFKIPDKRKQQGTLIWIPSDATDVSMQDKPSAAIYFETTNKSSATGKMHFVVTREDGEVLEVEVSHKRETPVWKRDYFLWIFPYYEIDKKHEEHSWNSYGLTYETKNEQSILTAYIDGEKVGEDIKDGAVRAHKSEYGMILGRTPYSLPDDIGNRHFFGIMDQAGMDGKAFTPDEMELWHQGVMKSTLVQYIRD
ncbi:MAG: hypothetical protein M0Q99_12215 [Candidatus Cloacimonetes bacterium]|nr:hypothetical protein [Candidatus Cloacimonadota bacterium]MCK9336062.1 hypothetical protein [Candidatus Cloacimonadota bacterium]